MVNMGIDDGVERYTPNPYGYGLCLELTAGQCEALGITQPPSAGTRMAIRAMCYVAKATQSVEDDGDDAGPDVSLCLQITDMELGTPSSNDASVLYPTSKGD